MAQLHCSPLIIWKQWKPAFKACVDAVAFADELSAEATFLREEPRWDYVYFGRRYWGIGPLAYLFI